MAKLYSEWMCVGEEDDSMYARIYGVYLEKGIDGNQEVVARNRLPYPEGVRCIHSYDCCGNWYPYAPQFIGCVGRIYYFLQKVVQNI